MAREPWFAGDASQVDEHQRDDDTEDEPADVGEETRRRRRRPTRTISPKVGLDELGKRTTRRGRTHAENRTGKTKTSVRILDLGYSTKKAPSTAGGLRRSRRATGRNGGPRRWPGGSNGVDEATA